MDWGVFCTYCGQRFSRGEHLERHVLTRTLHLFCIHSFRDKLITSIDTNVKPYKCEICHSSFNRQDLFQRHVRLVHKENSDSDSTERARIACQSCAKAKIKCDKEVSRNQTLLPTYRSELYRYLVLDVKIKDWSVIQGLESEPQKMLIASPNENVSRNMLHKNKNQSHPR